VLEALLDLEGGLSVREVARLTRLSATTASSALRALHSVGLVTRRSLGQNVHYTIAPEHVLVAPLQDVSSLAREVDALVAGEVKQVFGHAIALWLYGSRATGNERADSDADLIAVFPGPGDAERAAADAPPLEDRLAGLLGYGVSLTCAAVPAPDDWQTPFWVNVLREGVSLAGPEPHDVHDLGTDLAAQRYPWTVAR
jgi:DNA-binding transcriptional ArsR family regulator